MYDTVSGALETVDQLGLINPVRRTILRSGKLPWIIVEKIAGAACTYPTSGPTKMAHTKKKKT
jgi:hypothetical protein